MEEQITAPTNDCLWGDFPKQVLIWGLSAFVLWARWAKVYSWLWQDAELTRDTQWPSRENRPATSRQSRRSRGQSSPKSAIGDIRSDFRSSKCQWREGAPGSAPTTALFTKCNMVQIESNGRIKKWRMFEFARRPLKTFGRGSLVYLATSNCEPRSNITPRRRGNLPGYSDGAGMCRGGL